MRGIEGQMQGNSHSGTVLSLGVVKEELLFVRNSIKSGGKRVGVVECV